MMKIAKAEYCRVASIIRRKEEETRQFSALVNEYLEMEGK